MSSIQFRCGCGYERKISSKYAGKKVKCPKCSAPVRMSPPAASTGQPPKSVVPPPIHTTAPPVIEPEVAKVTPDVPPPVPVTHEQDWDLARAEEGPVSVDEKGSFFSWLAPPEQPGYEPPENQRAGVQWLAGSFFLLALFGMGPALLRLVNYYRLEEPPGIFCWTYLVLIAGMMQLAYAVYLYQLPDWSTVWVISLVALIMTTFYAVLFVIRLLASDTNPVLMMLQLHYETVSEGKQAGWCFCMLLVSGTFTYFAGRFGIRWKQQYKQSFLTDTPSS